MNRNGKYDAQGLAAGEEYDGEEMGTETGRD